MQEILLCDQRGGPKVHLSPASLRAGSQEGSLFTWRLFLSGSFPASLYLQSVWVSRFFPIYWGVINAFLELL